jgi:hypothetical protein
MSVYVLYIYVWFIDKENKNSHFPWSNFHPLGEATTLFMNEW